MVITSKEKESMSQNIEQEDHTTSPGPSSTRAYQETDAYTHPFASWGWGMRGGGMRGGFRGRGMRGGPGHAHPYHPHHHQRDLPETVSLEGDGHHGHGHGHPDPPLAPTPPSAPGAPPAPPAFPNYMAGFGNGFASLVNEHARSFAGDLAAHFGQAPPPPPAPTAPGAPPPPPPPPMHPHHGPHHRGPMWGGWGMRGRGMRGWPGRGGRGGMRGPHHPFWPGHAGPRSYPGHFPHHEHGPIRPKMNIQHVDNIYTITVELPGLQKEDVDISVDDNVLTIAGEFVDTAPGETPDVPAYTGEGYDMVDEQGEEIYPGEEEEEIVDGVNGMHLEDGSKECDGFVLRERRFGPFKRSVKLPSWVNVDAIKATMNHGVLSLVVEKPDDKEKGAAARKIRIF